VVKATTYYLLSPIVLCRMVERRLTLVDLALDRQVHVEYALVQAVYHTRAEGVDTLTSFGEFERVLDGVVPTDVKSGPGAARDLFDDFTPATRPVLWRLMVIQSMLYWCIQQVVWDGQLPGAEDVAGTFAQSSVFRDLSARVESYGDGPPAESFGTTVRAAAAYFASRVAPSLATCRG
jgi:hypothetical protein